MGNYQKKVDILEAKEGYNKIAKQYINFHKHLNEFEKGVFMRYIPRDLSGKKILDIGAGDGRIFNFFKTKKFQEYVAFDLAENLLEKHPNGKNIRKIIGDLNEDLNFEDNYFDLVTSFFVLEHLRELDNVFSEIFRILKPGGQRIIGHFLQRREVVFQTGKEKFKIQQYRRRKEEITKLAKENLFKIHIQDIEEKGNLLGRIFVLKKI